MPKVSINILTKNRAQSLHHALVSVANQSFKDYEVIIINDGSIDETQEHLKIPNTKYQIPNTFQIINHPSSTGITISRQEALLASQGEYVAILDDDDEWMDRDKLLKQTKFLDEHKDYVLVGGGIKSIFNFSAKGGPASGGQFSIFKHRPHEDKQIRRAMLFRNNFFTSTVMFRRQAAINAGGFVKDEYDLAEDYDLWLRLGKSGKMANFKEVFALYQQSNYNKERRKQFFKKQLKLIIRHKDDYPYAWLAKIILNIRISLLLV